MDNKTTIQLHAVYKRHTLDSKTNKLKVKGWEKDHADSNKGELVRLYQYQTK